MITTCLVLLSSVALGALIVSFFQPKKANSIKLLLSFSGAYLFSITILHLIPELYALNSQTNISLFVLLGFFLQIVLEFFTQGIEHGHGHLHQNGSKEIIPFSLMAALCLHALLEGMPLGNHQHDAHNALLTGVFLHKIPVAIVLLTLFLDVGIKKTKAYGLLLVFALMSPLGVWVSQITAQISTYHNQLMALVVGIFLHISTTILFESSNGHQFNKHKTLAIITGAAIAWYSFAS